MNTDPLNEDELRFLDEVLTKYGNDDSVLNASELDGFLTALVSGPEIIEPSVWLPELWGGPGSEPEWEDAAEAQRFIALAIRHMGSIADCLAEAPEEYEALLEEDEVDGRSLPIAEEWSFGYMRGVELAQWPDLPDDVEPHLDAIALHGTEERFDELDAMSADEFQAAVARIEPAVRALHAYWLEQREPE